MPQAGVFISIGGPLTKAGPLGLLIGVAIWCSVVWVGACALARATPLTR
jgi:amino acid transporter